MDGKHRVNTKYLLFARILRWIPRREAEKSTFPCVFLFRSHPARKKSRSSPRYPAMDSTFQLWVEPKTRKEYWDRRQTATSPPAEKMREKPLTESGNVDTTNSGRIIVLPTLQHPANPLKNSNNNTRFVDRQPRCPRLPRTTVQLKQLWSAPQTDCQLRVTQSHPPPNAGRHWFRPSEKAAASPAFPFWWRTMWKWKLPVFRNFKCGHQCSRHQLPKPRFGRTPSIAFGSSDLARECVWSLKHGIWIMTFHRIQRFPQSSFFF